MSALRSQESIERQFGNQLPPLSCLCAVPGSPSACPPSGCIIADVGCMQVALFQGVDADAKAELAKGGREGGPHLNKLLKVLTVRSEVNHERSGITLLGGPHNPELDGQVSGSYVPP